MAWRLQLLRKDMQHSLVDVGTRTLGLEYSDLLTVECEPALQRLIEDTFPSTACALVHADTTEEALAYLRYNIAAVALVHVAPHDSRWREILVELQTARDAPEVIVVARTSVACADALNFGSLRVLVPPLSSESLLYTVSGAWHRWLCGHGGSL